MNKTTRAIEEAKALARSFQYEDAFKLLDRLIEESPSDPIVRLCRAYVFDHKGDPEAAAWEISQAIVLHDREPDYFLTRARYYMMSGRFEDALKDLTTTLTLCDEHRSDYYREAAHLFRAECPRAAGQGS